MARPAKQGLNYFPLDVDFFEDIKIRKLKKACGVQAIPVFIDILCNIYREDGYYCGIGDDETFLMAERFGMSEGAISEIVKKSVSVGLFDRRMFDQYQILTSRAIQERYFKVCLDCKKKVVRVTGDFLLVDIIPELMVVSSGIIGVNSGINEQSKEKESKVNKSIGKSNSSSLSLLEAEEVIAKWNELGLSTIEKINTNTNRYRLLKARLNEYGMEKVLDAMNRVKESAFLRGQNDRGWTITFDWLVKPNNFVKVLEGNYKDYSLKEVSSRKRNGFHNFEQRTDGMSAEELEALFEERRKELKEEI